MTSSELLNNISHAYFIGIKGVGMTALAQLLVDRGIAVSGCDVATDFVTAPLLNSLAVTIDTVADPELPDDIDCLIYSGAFAATKQRLVSTAQQRKIQIFSLAKITGLLSSEKSTIAVCGVGGKSTTSALLAWIMEQLATQPSYLVGVGEILNLPQTGKWVADGKDFIVEADEYAENPVARTPGEAVVPKFHYLDPTIIICTNLQFDHPDVYASFESTQQAFYTFFLQIRQNGTLIWNADDSNLSQLVQQLRSTRPDIRTVSFGTDPTADVRLIECGWKAEQYQASISATAHSEFTPKTAQISWQQPGIHNAKNAVAAWVALRVLGYNSNDILSAIKSFASTARRFQIVRTVDTTTYIDDYAHHPIEIKQVIAACKDRFSSKQLIVIFQPHTFSRTQALLADFSNAFVGVDRLLLVPIFHSAREQSGAITVDDLATSISQSNDAPTKTEVCPSLEAAVAALKQTDLIESVVLTLGAGDVYQIHQLLSEGHNV